MVSILVLTRDAPKQAMSCVNALLATTAALQNEQAFELVLVDDHSDPAHGIVEMFKRARQATRTPVQIIRFKSHQHYAHGLAYGFAAARGSSVLFVSHDMMIAPACMRTLLELAAVDPAYGIIRPVSRHMDCAENIVLQPPFQMRSYEDVSGFSRLVRRQFGLMQTPWGILIGDAMLVQQSVIDKIGVPDMRYFGFMADIDYGHRARRAGFSLPIAHGAWLHHYGHGHVRESASADTEQLAIRQKNIVDADQAWSLFRKKWGTELPETYRKLDLNELNRLMVRDSADGSSDYCPPPALDPSVCEIH